jgi:uncharacterized protein (TIGR03437 family)
MPGPGIIYTGLMNGAMQSIPIGPDLLAPSGINNIGQIVGNFPNLFASGNVIGTVGFLRADGNYTIIQYPGAANTKVYGINSAGQIVGDYGSDPLERTNHGFVWSGGTFKTIDYPGAAGTIIHGINDKGDMVGSSFDRNGGGDSIIYSNGAFKVANNNYPVIPSGINNAGHMTGQYGYYSGYGYVLTNDVLISYVRFPTADSTFSIGINDSDDVVGYYTPGPHPFVLSKNGYVTIDPPSGPVLNGGSVARGINNAGQIVGSGNYGFVAACGQPIPAKVQITGGDAQAASVGSKLQQPLRVKVTASAGYGALGVKVNFAITSGGGTLDATTATTEADGTALATLTLGNTAGPVQVTATVPGLPAVSFSATATAVTLLPIMVLPSNLTFNYVIGSTKPTSAMIAVSSPQTVAFLATSNSSWLSVNPGLGQTPGNLTVDINPSGLTVGVYNGTITVSPSMTGYSSTTIPVALTITPAPPQFTADGLLSGGSNLSGPIAPGEIILLNGSNMGPPTLIVSQDLTPDARIPTVLAGTRVLFDEVPAPILSTSANQISAIVPYSVSSEEVSQVKVEYNAVQSVPIAIQVTASSPALFTTNMQGTGQASATNEDGSANSNTNPASVGTAIILAATGEGQTDPASADGTLSDDNPPKPVLPVNVTIDGQPATVQAAGTAPGKPAGFLEVTVIVPDGVSSGDVPIILTIGDRSSQLGVTVAVLAGVPAAADGAIMRDIGFGKRSALRSR